jgi:putative iron-only hydrogenase system regulator
MSKWHRVFLYVKNDKWRESPLKRSNGMETRIALIGIIVEDVDAVERLNGLLHDYGQYIIGRMGIPYREKNINIISVVVNAEADIISTLAGKLGMIKGVNVKTIYSKK